MTTANTPKLGWRPAVPPLLLLSLLFLLYALSYPFFIGPVATPQNASNQLYKPVEWLIDTTPLMTPMRAWARIWNLDDRVDLHYLMREANRHRAPGEVDMKTYSR